MLSLAFHYEQPPCHVPLTPPVWLPFCLSDAPPHPPTPPESSLELETPSSLSPAKNKTKIIIKAVRANLTFCIILPTDKRLMSWHAHIISQGLVGQEPYSGFFPHLEPVICLYLTPLHTIFPCMLSPRQPRTSVFVSMLKLSGTYDRWYISCCFFSKHIFRKPGLSGAF